jgi:hypothetical protein
MTGMIISGTVEADSVVTRISADVRCGVFPGWLPTAALGAAIGIGVLVIFFSIVLGSALTILSLGFVPVAGLGLFFLSKRSSLRHALSTLSDQAGEIQWRRASSAA